MLAVENFGEFGKLFFVSPKFYPLKFYTSQKLQKRLHAINPIEHDFELVCVEKWVAFYNIAYKPVFSSPPNQRFSSTAYGCSLALPTLLRTCN